MSLSLFFGVLILTPAVMALAILGLGLAQRARAPLALGLTALGALVPAVGLVMLAPDLSLDVPFHVALWPGANLAQSWFGPVLRADHMGLYAALGLAFLVMPLLLWIGWQTTKEAPAADDLAATDGGVASTDDAGEATAEGDAEDLDTTPSTLPAAGILRREQWASLALVLGIETAGLFFCFADNIVWLGISWIALAALTWGLGELGSGGNMLDRRGLSVMLAGPVLWLGAMLLAVVPLQAPRFYDLTGRGSVPALKVLLLALTLALAGGAYPFLVWVRRRAAFTTPAGLGAMVLTVLPAAIFAGGRTYGAVQDTAGLWPQIGTVTPPITMGIAFSILGAITIGVCGLLALGRGDGRSLLALLASAQVGWALFALGANEPAAGVGLVVLLTTAVLGLGAMVASLVSGGLVTTDVEPAGAGPRAFGAPLRAVNLFAWSAGALALVGAPLFAGFVSRQMITAGALAGTKLTVPLLGLAWGGDALLALALLRAVAPALRGKPATEETLDADAEEDETLQAAAANLESDTTMETDDEGEELELTPAQRPSMLPGFLDDLTFGEALGAIFAVLALLIGIVPQVLLSVGGLAAAGDLLQPDAATRSVGLLPLGYQIGAGQWVPTTAWIAVALLALVFTGLRLGMARIAAPAQLAGQATLLTDESAETEESGLTAPADLWKDLEPAFHSAWALPGIDWLLSGVEDDSEAEIVETDEELTEEEAPVVAGAAASDAEDDASTDAAPITPRKTKAARAQGANDTGGQA